MHSCSHPWRDTYNSTAINIWSLRYTQNAQKVPCQPVLDACILQRTNHD